MPSKPIVKKKPAAPPPEPPKQVSVEERTASLEVRLQKADPAFQAQYRENLDMSWIYHDSALEGVVYSFQELRTAIDPSANVALDSSLQPVCEEIRRHREALDYIREYAVKKKQPITLDVVKKIYLILHPEEGDIKSVRYRKDIPQHRLYFHEYAAPDKITYKMRQVIDWVNDPETKRTRSPIRIAGRAHYDLLRVFPFTHDSGKVARLFMNLLLLRNGYPPAIVHSTERQRYYEALKGSSATMMQIVQEALENNLASIEKLLDAYDSPEAE
jgi:Fic family protein